MVQFLKTIPSSVTRQRAIRRVQNARKEVGLNSKRERPPDEFMMQKGHILFIYG